MQIVQAFYRYIFIEFVSRLWSFSQVLKCFLQRWRRKNYENQLIDLMELLGEINIARDQCNYNSVCGWMESKLLIEINLWLHTQLLLLKFVWVSSTEDWKFKSIDRFKIP